MTRPTVEVPIAEIESMKPRVWPDIFNRPSDTGAVPDADLDVEEYRVGLDATQEIACVE